jgi:hypothetical protein
MQYCEFSLQNHMTFRTSPFFDTILVWAPFVRLRGAAHQRRYPFKVGTRPRNQYWLAYAWNYSSIMQAKEHTRNNHGSVTVRGRQQRCTQKRQPGSKCAKIAGEYAFIKSLSLDFPRHHAWPHILASWFWRVHWRCQDEWNFCEPKQEIIPLVRQLEALNWNWTQLHKW